MDLFDEVPAPAPSKRATALIVAMRHSWTTYWAKEFRVAPFALSEGNRLAKGLAALAAGLPVAVQDHELVAGRHR